MTSRPMVEAVGEAGRSAAFQRLAAEHLVPSYRLARAILGSSADAEDATHDAFVQAWRRWSSLRDSTRFEAWFDRILVNTCRNRLRSRRRFVVHDVSAELEVVAPEQLASAHDREELGRALTLLSPDHRIVIALRYYRDLSTEDIADRIGVPHGTVRSRLHYALESLNATLARHREGPRP